MKREERVKTLARLDGEQRHHQKAAESGRPCGPWLREIRLALKIPARELAERAGINRTEIYRAEGREVEKHISLAALERMAEALGCRLVYAVVPKKGTLEGLSIKRAWESLLGEGGEKKLRAMLKYEKQADEERPAKKERRRQREDRSYLLQGDRKEDPYYFS